MFLKIAPRADRFARKEVDELDTLGRVLVV